MRAFCLCVLNYVKRRALFASPNLMQLVARIIKFKSTLLFLFDPGYESSIDKLKKSSLTKVRSLLDVTYIIH